MNLKQKNMMLLFYLLLGYIILFSDCKLTLENKHKIYKFEYNGLVWVALDAYTIVKYNSKDELMKFIYFEIIDKQK